MLPPDGGGFVLPVLDAGVTQDGGARDGGLVRDGGAADGGVKDGGPPKRACVPDGGARQCDDQNPCTTDKCDTGSKTCRNTPVPIGSACGQGGVCVSAVCTSPKLSGTGCSAAPEGSDMATAVAWLLASLTLLALLRRRRRSRVVDQIRGLVVGLLVCLGGGVFERARADDTRVQEFQRHLARGLLFAETNRVTEGIASLRRAHAVLPARLDVQLQIASLEARLGNDGEAERQLRAVLRVRPDYADALRELGAFFLERNRPTDALPLLEAACAKKPRDGEAHFFRGSALGDLGREEPAREALAEALRLAPELASRVHVELAESHERAGDIESAKRALSAAITANTDAETVRAARESLAQVGKKKPEARKWWSLSARFTAEADSNVSLLADASATPLGAGTTVGGDAGLTREAARATLELGLNIVPIEGRHTFDFGFSFFQSKHMPSTFGGGFVLTAFDQTVASVYAGYAFRGRAGTLPVRLEVGIGHNVTWLDLYGAATRHFLENPWGRASVVFTYQPWGELRISYRFGFEDYATGNAEATPDDRDGVQHLGALENTFFFGKSALLRATVFGAYYGAHGRRWTAILAGGAVDAQYKVLSWLTLAAGGATLRRDYTASDYTRTLANGRIESVQRSDQSYFAFARLLFSKLKPNVALFYNYGRNESTLNEVFGFRRHVGGVDLRHTF